MKWTVFQVEVKIKATPSVQNISSETTEERRSGEADKTDSEGTESVNSANLVVVKASPAIVVDSAEKGE